MKITKIDVGVPCCVTVDAVKYGGICIGKSDEGKYYFVIWEKTGASRVVRQPLSAVSWPQIKLDNSDIEVAVQADIAVQE